MTSAHIFKRGRIGLLSMGLFVDDGVSSKANSSLLVYVNAVKITDVICTEIDENGMESNSICFV